MIIIIVIVFIIAFILKFSVGIEETNKRKKLYII